MSFPSQHYFPREETFDASSTLDMIWSIPSTQSQTLAPWTDHTEDLQNSQKRAADIGTNSFGPSVLCNPDNLVNTGSFAFLPPSWSQWPIPFSPSQQDMPTHHHPPYTNMMPYQGSHLTQTRGDADFPLDGTSYVRSPHEGVSMVQRGSSSNRATHRKSAESRQMRPLPKRPRERRSSRSSEIDGTVVSNDQRPLPTTWKVTFPSLSLVETTDGSMYGSGILSTAHPSFMSRQGISFTETELELPGTQQKESTHMEEFKRNGGFIRDVNLEAIEPAKPGQFVQAGDAICAARVGMCTLRSMEDREFRPEEVKLARWIVGHAFTLEEAEGLTFEHKLYLVKKQDISPTDRPLKKVLPGSKETDRALMFRYLTAFRSYNDKIHGNGNCLPCIRLRPRVFHGFRCKRGTILSDLEHILDRIFEILKYLLERSDVRDMEELLNILTPHKPE